MLEVGAEDRGVQPVDVAAVVPAVVDLEGLGRDDRLERVEGVGKGCEKTGHGFTSCRHAPAAGV